DLGYTDTPQLPGQKWLVHDSRRPRPPLVTAGATPGAPPSDAVVLFDGKDLSAWVPRARMWKVENGYFEIAPGTGDLVSKDKFGDCQIHIEWASPAKVARSGQSRGNSGVIIMGRYEVQVLDSWENLTYADGQAAAIYAQWPPLVNVSRPPGEWQSFDIVFEAPRFEGPKLARPAFLTVFHNGALMHHRRQLIGRMVHRQIPTYAPHAPEEPLSLQDHDYPVRFRNIWVRRLTFE
ncbi:MAG: 3-keto-disaccharide hydrolase, partial [Bryobacteraceae bacterium]